jgi:DNA-binding NtrC family response regulator
MLPSVLLVDDDPNLLAALQRGLHREPYAICTAPDPVAAFRILAERPVDVVISDEGMPRMPGSVFLARVHERYPDTIRMILTGQGSLAIAIRAINEGHVYRFLTKPCNVMELAIAIRQGLQQRALLAESRRLLHTVKRQSRAMAELATEVSGVAGPERDESGAIVLEDVPIDLDALLQEAEKAVRAAEDRLESCARPARRDASSHS